MTPLFALLQKRVAAWRDSGYPSEKFSAIGEILAWAATSDDGRSLRFLRRPQVLALETYWYLRLVENTPHVFDLYRRIYSKQSELLSSLGLESEEIRAIVLDDGIEALWNRIRDDDAFVRDFKLEALRETLTLAYPSYILALAMGAGKTILIGAIAATEFAMVTEYPDGPFVANALVFAPGKTIIESLRELIEVPYQQILPPRFHKSFAASVKFTFTRDGEKTIPVVPGSLFNVVVTNTEKIRIQKETIRKSDIGSLFNPVREDEARSEVANLRLQAIASLPHLAVFSDEAHHTYGQSLDVELKKVRKTVDYLAQNTNVVCVVNTTGTPYFQRQPLRDVVIWYGLSEGIKENILKDLAGSIQSYDFEGNTGAYLEHVIKDFFQDYRDVQLPNGAPARLAIYFPQTDDLRELKPVVDAALTRAGLSPAVCLVNTSDDGLTKAADIDAFNRLNDPAAPHRVILLVNKGTEGWNCPSLFACALARKLKSSNNFVLQAATRCLRQVPGNTAKARVYLSNDNFGVLDRQLQETYGESIADLNHAAQETRRARIVLRKLDIPRLTMTRTVRTVVPQPGTAGPLALTRPGATAPAGLARTTFTLARQEAGYGVLTQVGDTVSIATMVDAHGRYDAAVILSAQYRLDLWDVHDELARLYGDDDIPYGDLEVLSRQIEAQRRGYAVIEEQVEVAFALVKPEGFDRALAADGSETYTAEIVYPKAREHLLARLAQWQEKSGNFGFHYEPYNFDSQPEMSFFEQMLNELNLHPDDIEDIYFTGAITDPAKTDFFIEYKDEKGKWRRYTPDFVVRRKPPAGAPPGSGKTLIVEIKREHDRTHPVDGEQGRKALALRRWEGLNPDRLKYQMIFTATQTVSYDQVAVARTSLIKG